MNGPAAIIESFCSILAGWLAGWPGLGFDDLDDCWLDAWKLETLSLNSHTLDAWEESADERINLCRMKWLIPPPLLRNCSLGIVDWELPPGNVS